MIGNPESPWLDSRQSLSPRTRPWREVSAAALRQVRGVMTDIDDTLTAEGRLDPSAADALAALHTAGVPVVAITGRPMGWSEDFVRPGPGAWPVRAIVAENGAVALLPEGDAVRVEYVQDDATRARNHARLMAVQQCILADVPGATAARDSAGRVTDIAIDHSEFAHLDEAAIAQVVATMQAAGMTATVSSIHVNGWFGTHDKLSGARWMTQRLFGTALDDELGRWVYVGDSTNDQLMFGHFPLSVGVANLMHFADRLHTWPTFITDSERGRGFAEVARALLAVRT